ncbi:hypothetical protein BD779DRAFT_207881 [Infundibulicybe gibba]|nr:hypothetical protein BD779DRAFT_207881 [Infundibulicybe gibba]
MDLLTDSSTSTSITSWLPLEILTIIFLLCSRRDQISLCQTSKFFDELGASIFYRKIQLPLSKELCQIFSANTRKASAVRDVIIFEPYPYPLPALVPALNTSLILALKCLTKVERLTLDSRLFTHAYNEILRDVSFPMLCSLTMNVKYINTSLLQSFLSRHPCIIKLILNGHMNLLDPSLFPTQNTSKHPAHSFAVWVAKYLFLPLSFLGILATGSASSALPWQHWRNTAGTP